MYSVPAAIESERLLLRRFHAPDLAPFTRFMTTPEVTRTLAFPEEIITAERAAQLLEATLISYDSEKPLFALAVEEKASHAFVGCCGVNPLDEGVVEIFYAVAPECWGRGLATEMAQALTSYLFEQAGVNVVKAFIVPGHEASKRVARKVGFRDTGLVANPNFSEEVHQYVLTQQGS